MPGGHGHENEEEREHHGKVSGISSRHCGQTMVDGKWGGFREAAGEGMRRYLPFCCSLTWGLASCFLSCKTRMDPTGKKRDENVRDSLVTFPCGWFRNEEAARPWHPGAWRRFEKTT